MGSWGLESSANDYCWDNLHANDIHKMNQDEADKTINLLMKQDDREYLYDSLVLGVVTFILYKELIVSEEALKLAIECANKMLVKDSKSWEENVFGDGYLVDERTAIVLSEKKDCEEALKNGGKGKAKHVKGLLERFGELDLDKLFRGKTSKGH